MTTRRTSQTRSRSSPSFRLGILGVLLALLTTTALTVLSTGATATTPTTGTVATATVKGYARGVNQVTGYDGPLAGATVKISRSRTGETLRYVTTRSDGSYVATGLPAVGIKVKIRKPGWLGTYVGGARTWDSAQVYYLTSGTTKWLPKTLVYAEAAIEGQTLGWMDPLGAVTVTVFNADTGAVLGRTVSDGDGYYRIGQLPPARIKVRGAKVGWLTDWANNRDSWAQATVFTLKAGQTLVQTWSPTTNLYLDLAPMPAFRGETFGLNNDPLNGWDDPVPGATITVLDAQTGAFVAKTTTDEFGTFSLGVPREHGLYKLRVSKPGWLTTYAPNAFTWDDATVFSLDSGDYIKDVGLVYMFAPAAIEGQTLGWFDPLGGVTVKVFDAATGRLLGSAVSSEGDGIYRIGDLPPVAVKVKGSKTGWLSSWANGASSWSTAAVLQLDPGVTLSQSWDPHVLYLDLSPAGS